jgi:hypothetical protein
MRIWVALRAFFAILFKRDVAERVERALQAEAVAEVSVRAVEERKLAEKPAALPKPVRSEALTLLAALQREARFVDFIKESLSDYTDEQIGAAVRDVHRLCGDTLNRLFELRPIVAQPEGANIEVPAGFDAARYRLVGNVVGSPPFRGRLAHHGWEAARCDVPAWSGSAESALVVAPAEVEVK